VLSQRFYFHSGGFPGGGFPGGGFPGGGGRRRRRHAPSTAEPLPDHYDVLGVAPDADPRVIKKQYRRLAREFHPDKHAGPGREAQRERAQKKFVKVAAAYEVLSDPAARREYDHQRRYGAAPGGPQTSSAGARTAWTLQQEMMRAAQQARARRRRQAQSTNVLFSFPKVVLLFCTLLIAAAVMIVLGDFDPVRMFRGEAPWNGNERRGAANGQRAGERRTGPAASTGVDAPTAAPDDAAPPHPSPLAAGAALHAPMVPALSKTGLAGRSSLAGTRCPFVVVFVCRGDGDAAAVPWAVVATAANRFRRDPLLFAWADLCHLPPCVSPWWQARMQGAAESCPSVPLTALRTRPAVLAVRRRDGRCSLLARTRPFDRDTLDNWLTGLISGSLTFSELDPPSEASDGETHE
jgi:hypothetical protein